MAINFEILQPTSGAIDVPLNTEVVVRVWEDTASIFEEINIIISDVTGNLGIFNWFYGTVGITSGWTYEQIDDGVADHTFVIMRPAIDPEYVAGRTIGVAVFASLDAGGSDNTNWQFTTLLSGYAIPDTYTIDEDMTSLPAGWVAQSSGDGSDPIFTPLGMTTYPGTTGTSSIYLSPAGLDFETGVLIDMVVRTPSSPLGSRKVLSVFKGGQGLVSVSIDFANGEIWLGDIVNEVGATYRPGLNGSNVSLRLTIKGSGNNLIARLYADELVQIEPTLLQQTGGPSTSIGVSQDIIEIGSLDAGDDNVRIESLKILLGEDPDNYYSFPIISDITPNFGVVNGGGDLEILFDKPFDVEAGSHDLTSHFSIFDESSGDGSILVTGGYANLNINGIGLSRLRFTNSMGSDIPAGANINIDLEADETFIVTPTQSSTIIAAAEIRMNGSSYAFELVSNQLERAFFREIIKSGTTIISQQKILNTTSNMHNIRFVRAENKLITYINNININSLKLSNGIGVFCLYSESTENVVLNSKFSNFVVKPVVMIGDSIAI